MKKNILGSSTSTSTSTSTLNSSSLSLANIAMLDDDKVNGWGKRTDENTNILTIPLTKPSFIQPEKDRLEREKKSIKNGVKKESVGSYRKVSEDKKIREGKLFYYL